MNITLSIDEKVAKAARKVALAMGKSLNQLVRDYLEQLTRQSEVQDEMNELRRLSQKSDGHSAGWRFDREELHGRS